MTKEKKESVDLFILNSHETITYAAEELAKYICLITDLSPAAVTIRNSVKSRQPHGINLGLFSDFKLDQPDDPERDDAIHLSVHNGQGIMAGSNPRSLLFAVYRFLEANGCQWIRPGKNGEIIPRCQLENLHAEVADKALYRFRGNSKCGMADLEKTLEKIEWMPRKGLNTFFREGLLYYLPENDREVIQAVKKRGLIYHNAGHGWPAAFYKATSIEPVKESDFTEKAENEPQFLALVDGRRTSESHARKRSRGPKNTELCYGNPTVRERLVKCVADYAEEFPEIDLLHFWLSDSMNIHCECELCIDTRPADFYVMMLNAIDSELGRRKLDTRIAFLVYQDLLWAPEHEKFINPDRFVMMFAPIARRYSEPYSDQGDKALLGEFAYNQNSQNMKMPGFIAAINDWQKLFPGDSFTFDYHMTWYHYFDLGYCGFTEMMAEDIKRLPNLNQNGFVSCQIVCATFPTGFPFEVHASYLWNPNRNFEELRSAYFTAAFGEDGGLCLEYMKKLSELSNRDFFYRYCLQTDLDQPDIIEDLKQVQKVVEFFRPIVENNLRHPVPACAQSWKYLFIHLELVLLLAHTLRAKIEQKPELANAYWTKVVEYVVVNEKKLSSVFDPHWFFKSYSSRVELKTIDFSLQNQLADMTKAALGLA